MAEKFVIGRKRSDQIHGDIPSGSLFSNIY